MNNLQMITAFGCCDVVAEIAICQSAVRSNNALSAAIESISEPGLNTRRMPATDDEGHQPLYHTLSAEIARDLCLT